jgi:hypothetical protein
MLFLVSSYSLKNGSATKAVADPKKMKRKTGHAWPRLAKARQAS